MDVNKYFERFVYTVDGKEYALEDVQKEYEEHNGNISKYKGKMVCPECKKAELAFHKKSSRCREYLSRIHSSNHTEGCSYIHDYASKKVIMEYFSRLSEEQIKDKLESALNLLIRVDSQSKVTSITDAKSNPLVICNKKRDGNYIYRTIPRKSLTAWFDKSEAGKMFIFYGRVKLEVQDASRDKPGYYNLAIWTPKNNDGWKYKTKVFRGRTKDMIDSDAIYDIAILGELKYYSSEKNPDERVTPEIDLPSFNENYIALRKL